MGRVGLLQQQVALAGGGWQVEKETPVPLPATTTTTNHPTIHSAKHGFPPKKSFGICC